MTVTRPRCRRTVLLLGVALLTLGNGGCLWLAAGAAAGGAASYAYYKGNVSRVYPADVARVHTATRESLAELGMPVVEDQVDAYGAMVTSRTSQGHPVRIYLTPEGGPQTTRAGVRVGVFGDEKLSTDVLNRLGTRLPGVTQTGPGQQIARGPQTAPPPLADKPATTSPIVPVSGWTPADGRPAPAAAQPLAPQLVTAPVAHGAPQSAAPPLAPPVPQPGAPRIVPTPPAPLPPSVTGTPRVVPTPASLAITGTAPPPPAPAAPPSGNPPPSAAPRIVGPGS